MKIEIEIEIEDPGVDYTEDELITWIEWEMGIGSSISLKNPLVDERLDIKDSYITVR